MKSILKYIIPNKTILFIPFSFKRSEMKSYNLRLWLKECFKLQILIIGFFWLVFRSKPFWKSN